MSATCRVLRSSDAILLISRGVASAPLRTLEINQHQPEPALADALELLRREGRSSAESIANDLAVTTNAVRQHLTNL